MALNVADRLLTIVVTATLTSAAWIVAGTTVGTTTEPAPQPMASAAPSPATESSLPVPEAVRVGDLTIPVAGVTASQLRDTFNEARGTERRHEALDIMAAAGTPVLAAAPGTIEKLFLSDDGGNTIYVRSADRRTLFYYAHLQEYAAGLKEGQAIAAGQPVGTVGSTGNADPAGPHLHFAVMRTAPDAMWWEPATALNPYPMLVGG